MKALVVGHGDLTPAHLTYHAEGPLLLQGFEAARLMPAALDLGSLLVVAERSGMQLSSSKQVQSGQGISTRTVSLEHRQAIALHHC